MYSCWKIIQLVKNMVCGQELIYYLTPLEVVVFIILESIGVNRLKVCTGIFIQNHVPVLYQR